MKGRFDPNLFAVVPSRDIRLADLDPGSTVGFTSKLDARGKHRRDIAALTSLQEKLYADGRYALLVIFQGMDAAGKDGAIRHVLSGVSPQGVDVYPFKTPSARELSHDYLWRCVKVLPERGRIAIFNRSYYEELAIVRVHPELLERERLPARPAGSSLWTQRFAEITAFERQLTHSGTAIVKFFLNVSKDEQRKRLLKRIDAPDKNWKMSAADVRERTYWDTYQLAYEDLLAQTSTELAPWYVVPADHKWFTRAVVADILVSRLRELDPRYPELTEKRRAEIAIERELLR